MHILELDDLIRPANTFQFKIHLLFQGAHHSSPGRGKQKLLGRKFRPGPYSIDNPVVCVEAEVGTGIEVTVFFVVGGHMVAAD
jgi:hypothetical protein